MTWKPDITVAAIVADADRFLIVEEQIRGQRVFNQPAGRVEDGESLLDAVVRETLEETAWRFQPEWLLGVYSWHSPTRERSSLRFAFTGSVSAHDAARRLDPPVIATHWLSVRQLQERSRALRTPLVLRCIDDYLAGRRLPLTAINEVAS